MPAGSRNGAVKRAHIVEERSLKIRGKTASLSMIVGLGEAITFVGILVRDFLRDSEVK